MVEQGEGRTLAAFCSSLACFCVALVTCLTSDSSRFSSFLSVFSSLSGC